MPSLRTLPQKTWSYYATVTLALVTMAVGSALFFGGLDMIDFNLSGQTETASWQSTFALGGGLIALATLLFQLGWPSISWLGLLPAMLGASALIQPMFHYDPGFDTWLSHLMSGANGPSTVPMPSLVALSLLFGGGSLPWLEVRVARSWRVPLIALTGSMLAAVGGATLAGHALDLHAVTSLNPSVAVLVLALGAMLQSLAVREHTRVQVGAPDWLPVPFVACSAALTLVFWSGLRTRELKDLSNEGKLVSNQLITEIPAEFQQQADALEHFAQRWSLEGVPLDDIKRKDAENIIKTAPGAQSVDWITPEGELPVEWSSGHPQLKNFNQTSLDNRRYALNKAELDIRPQVSEVLDLPEIGKGFLLCAPVRNKDRLLGWVGIEYAYQPFLAAVVTKIQAEQHYRCVVYIAHEPVYTPTTDPALTDESLVQKSDVIKFWNNRWWIELFPKLDYLQRNRSLLPESTLFAGLGITLFLGLSVHLARSARSGLRSARDANHRLFAENEERRAVEARLKTSDERLNLALDSTALGIFEWNVAAGEILGNPGLWSVLGIPPALPAALPALWESQVHPDDLAAFRTTRAAQLAGIQSFTDAEYRMRAPDGSWRWLAVRAKTVASATQPPFALVGKDPRPPARIVGTVQDITAHKRAETALIESQTAARKLSLVASKTDNLVIIARPDGTIEWVNESFTRVMEWSLAEIAGRNPAHFMVGPDTSPRTARRLRLALARGTAISAEITCYTKSGRRFHLQLEVQPVRNERGSLENYIAILADITTRVETENALRRAKTEADAASRAKSEFLASLSHEIRTPMNGVIGMTSLLLDTTLNPEQRDCVGTIRSSGEALLSIINDILDFSKIEAGKFELDHQPYELAACVEETLDLFAALAASRNIELAHAIAADVPTIVIGDGPRLRQILTNLVNNAVKFTPSGRITVEVRQLHGGTRSPFGSSSPIPSSSDRIHLEFAVRDTGIGIPPDRLHRLFKPFSQVDASTTRKYGGTGLGLAICHRLCQLNGGDIRVESESGHGSAFIFHIAVERIPASRQPPPPALPPPLVPGTRVLCCDSNPVVLRWLAVFFERAGLIVTRAVTPAAARNFLRDPPTPLLVVFGLVPNGGTDALRADLATRDIPAICLHAPGLALPAAPSKFFPHAKPLRQHAFVRTLQALFKTPSSSLVDDTAVLAVNRPLAEDIPLTILLVEDNLVNQKVALRFLERLGYRADVAANGNEAIAAFAIRRYDFILMDIQMPEMDGYEATREIRRRQDPSRPPRIVALTANALQSDRDQSAAVGMDGFITKPVKLSEITATIRRLFAPVEKL